MIDPAAVCALGARPTPPMVRDRDTNEASGSSTSVGIAGTVTVSLEPNLPLSGVSTPVAVVLSSSGVEPWLKISSV